MLSVSELRKDFLEIIGATFVPHVRKYCQDIAIEYKILLLLDNATSHPSVSVFESSDGKVNRYPQILHIYNSYMLYTVKKSIN